MPKGTKAQRPKGPKDQKHISTKAQRPRRHIRYKDPEAQMPKVQNSTKAQQALKARRPRGPNAKRHKGPKAQRPRYPKAQRHESTET